jgi:hypothetical protein
MCAEFNRCCGSNIKVVVPVHTVQVYRDNAYLVGTSFAPVRERAMVRVTI